MLSNKPRPKTIQVLPPTDYNITFDQEIDPDPSLSKLFSKSSSYEETLITQFQISMYKPGISLQKELGLVFPDITVQNVYICPCFQPSQYDLIAVSPQTNWERDLLGHYFLSFARVVVCKIKEKGYWADVTDPGDGFPVYSRRGAALYPDVQGSVQCLKYSTLLVGCCKVIVHPVWGTRNYPSTLFTDAPPPILSSILDGITHVS